MHQMVGELSTAFGDTKGLTMQSLAELLVPLAVPVVAGTIAVFWPWLQANQRGRRFERIIHRELQEIGPYPKEASGSRPWWEYAKKRFVHEEIFRRDRISENRDFLLSLDPTTVYTINQLWISFDKRDGQQWVYYLGELGRHRRTSSPELRVAVSDWSEIMASQPDDWLEPLQDNWAASSKYAVERVPGLFEKRMESYAALARITRDIPNSPKSRSELLARIRQWYYDEGGGLLLSGRALLQFKSVQDALSTPKTPESSLHQLMSLLRTDLKIDLGVRHPDERLVQFSKPHDERTP